MNNPENNSLTHEVPVQRQKKPWHAVIAGIGCGIPTLMFAFLLLFAIASLAVFLFWGANEAQLTQWSQMDREDALLRLNVFFAIVLSISIVLAMLAAFFGGRTAYRHSYTPQATPRLFKSIFAGIGFGFLSSVIACLGGVILETSFFYPVDYTFGESAFSLMILILVLVSVFVTTLGGYLGAIIVFRRLLKKESAILDAKDQA